MNLVMHGARVGWVRSASFQNRLQPAAIDLKVLDEDEPFDSHDQALRAPPTSLERATPGGQGLGLMRRFARELRCATGVQGNCLTLLLDCG